MSFHTCVIVNPASAGGATGRRWPKIRADLDRHLDRWDNEFTLGPREATRIARRAVHEGYEMIVGIGGDGTMGEIVSGFFEEDPSGGITDRLIRPDVVLGVVRQGTGGDFARGLGLSSTLDGCTEHLAGAATRPADLGLIEYEDSAGKTVRSAFLNVASFGLSGLVDEKVNTTTKVFGARASFLIGLARAVTTYRPQRIRVRVDDVDLHEGLIAMGAVANGPYFGGGMRVAKDAKMDDGFFDVVLLLRFGLKEITSIRDIYRGAAASWTTVRTARGRTVEALPVEGEGGVLLDVDGEQTGRLPARFRVVPGAVRLKVSG